jgi:hypothetical protein
MLYGEEDAYVPRTRAEKRRDAVTEAMEDGYAVRYSSDHVLLLDLDSEEARERARAVLHRMKHVIGWERIHETRSRSGNWHWYVYLREARPVTERMLLQGVLGSDPIRAVLDWQTARETGDESFLFERPESKDVVLIEQAGVAGEEEYPR